MKWWQGGSHLSSVGCDISEQGHVPALPSALRVKSGLQIVLTWDLLIKKIVIIWHVDKATETRPRKVPMLIPLLSALTVISSDLCPGTKLHQWEIPAVSHSHRINTVMQKLTVDAKRGVSYRRNLSPFHSTCCRWTERHAIAFRCHPQWGAASLSLEGFYTEQTLLFGGRVKETKYLPTSCFLAAYFQVMSAE